MKIKHSNIIFFSYLGVIFLIAIGVLIYARVLISSGEFLKHENVKVDVNNTNLVTIPSFNVVYLKNVYDVDMYQTDSFAVEIPDSLMVVRNDTLFVENCSSAVILFESISDIIGENASLNLVLNKGKDLKIENSNAEINIAAVEFDKLLLISKGDCEFNITASKINTVDVDFLGKNEVNFFAKVKVLQGNNSDETEISILPKPKKVNLLGNTKLN